MVVFRKPAAVLAAGLIVLIVIGLALGEVAMHVTPAADLAAVRDLAGDRTGTLTSVARMLSELGRAVLITPLALLTAAILIRAKRRLGAVFVAVSVLGAVILFNVDKALVERPRPPVRHLESAGNWSFPSGHATTSSAFYLALALVLSAGRRRVRRVAIAAAILLFSGIAFSRVYLGVHYPADVAGGLLLGVAWCLLAYRIICQAGGRREPRIGPTARLTGPLR